jgi:hypothetical protein
VLVAAVVGAGAVALGGGPSARAGAPGQGDVGATGDASAVGAARGGGGDAEGPAKGPAAAGVADHAPDRLAVTVDDGAGGTTTYQLECHPAAGTHPDPAGACARLDALGGPLGPTPTDRMCSMVYGGPQTATVAGRWHGAEVVAHYRRTNGCESDRWRSMGPVLPSEEAAGGS